MNQLFRSKSVLVAIFSLLLIAVVFFMVYSNKSNLAVTDFESCKNAGFPVMESFPEQCMTDDGRTFSNDIQSSSSTTPIFSTSSPNTPSASNDVKLYNVAANQIIGSPLTIQGEARLYYFEGSFPVELVDANGKTLAIGPATAQGDWMTTSFVPFTITLTFPRPTTTTGRLIFRNDNPSGLPEHDKSFSIPIRFSQNERNIKLYYYNSSLDKDQSGNILCSEKGLVAVDRTIASTQTPLQDTLRLFLQGNLTAAEKNKGISTEYPLSGVTLGGASISNTGVLTLSISDPSNTTSGGACRSSVLRLQLEATARQFTEVSSVKYTTPVFQP